MIKSYTNTCDSTGRTALVSRTFYHRNTKMRDNGEFGQMKDELFRDQLTVGILDHTTSECLQMEPGPYQYWIRLARERQYRITATKDIEHTNHGETLIL